MGNGGSPDSSAELAEVVSKLKLLDTSDYGGEGKENEKEVEVQKEEDFVVDEKKGKAHICLYIVYM